MATVYEILESREGGTRGQHGAIGHGRSFHVTVDSVNDDPSAVIQTTPLTDTGELISIGAPHPWGAFGVVVTDFREAERLPTKDKKDWIVDALYGPPLIVDPSRPWDVSVDVSLDTYTAYTDLDGQVIGPAVYHPVPTDETFSAAALLAEKNRLRDKRGFDIDTVYRAPTSEGFIELYRAANNKRRAIGLPRTRKVAMFTLSKILPRLTASQIGAVMAMVNAVNATAFFGASKEQAKFVGIRARSGPGVMTGQTVPNVIWDVELFFAIDWDRHNPNSEFDMYEHSDGTRGIIETAAGQGVKRMYKLYQMLEFNTILSWLER